MSSLNLLFSDLKSFHCYPNSAFLVIFEVYSCPLEIRQLEVYRKHYGCNPKHMSPEVSPLNNLRLTVKCNCLGYWPVYI